ncbi:MAG: hypothetical protein OXU42_17640 [Deltaproteobacteria bacterium]|nr:hypothetical protein [Deltaproteobacteria bacterium]
MIDDLQDRIVDLACDVRALRMKGMTPQELLNEMGGGRSQGAFGALRIEHVRDSKVLDS